MSRVRLTSRDRSSADQTPYPGNVNQPDRNDPKWEQYHTFEQRVNHELPDMRHDWQNDSRDDIGFGVPETWGKSPTVASARAAATRAVRVAMLLLGDKVSDEVIEKQAQDLMAMGQVAMDRTLQRFADTQKLYADEAEDKDEECVAKKSADEKSEKVEDEKKAATGEAKFTPKIETPGAEVKAADEKKDEKKDEDKKSCAAADAKEEDKKEDAKDMKAMIVAAVAEAMKAALPDFIQKKVDEKKEDKKDEKKDDKKAADEKSEKVEEKKDDKKAADEKSEKVEEKVEEKKAAVESDKDEKAEEKKASVTKKGMNEFDIELTSAMDDEIEPDADADERLASALFSDDQGAGNSDGKSESSQKKAGISKLGGQPRVASVGAAGVDISSIWQSAPDVSEAFR